MSDAMTELKARALADIDRALAGALAIADLKNADFGVTALRACIERWSTPGSAYRAEAMTAAGVDPRVMAYQQYKGRLLALRQDIEADALATFAARMRGDALGSLLAQADELLEHLHLRAAAVVAGAALESHLRALATLRGVPTTSADARPPRAANLNEQLTKADVYSLVERDQQSANLRIRNEAAHGEPAFATRSAQEVRLMNASIRIFIDKYPA